MQRPVLSNRYRIVCGACSQRNHFRNEWGPNPEAVDLAYPVTTRFQLPAYLQPMKPADKEILSDLRRIIRSVNLEAKRVEREFGVSIPQYLCLQHLNEQPEFTASMKEIKDVLQLNASTATGIVQRLERGGYVAKLPKRDDKRKSLIVLTERGAEVVKRNPQILHERLLERLQELGPEEYSSLRSAFRVIIEFLEIERIDAAPIVTSEPMFPTEPGQ